MRRSFPPLAALLIPALATASPAIAQAHVRLGVDRLADSLPKVLSGKRVGLITNHTGRDRAGTPTIDLLAEWDRDTQRFREMRKSYLLY